MENIKVTMVPCIDCEDVKTLIGVSWNCCEFAQMAESGSYVPIYTDEEAVDCLMDHMDYIHQTGDFNKLARLGHNLRLVNALREMGYTDTVLINVNW